MSDIPTVRPMSFGEIFSETLRNYGRSFFPIFLVALVLQILATLVMTPMMTELENLQTEMIKNPTVMPQFDPTLLMLRATVTMIIVLTLTVITQAGLTVYYVGRLLGIKASIGKVFARIMPIAGRLFGLSAVVSLLIAAGPVAGMGIGVMTGGLTVVLLVLAGFAAAILLGIRLSLSGAALVVEGIPIRAALSRSQELSTGNRGKIFLIGLIYFGAVVVLSIPIGSLAIVFGSGLILNFVSAVVSAIIYPFLLCGLIQVYLSARAGQEQLDAEKLTKEFLGETGPKQGMQE